MLPAIAPSYPIASGMSRDTRKRVMCGSSTTYPWCTGNAASASLKSPLLLARQMLRCSR